MINKKYNAPNKTVPLDRLVLDTKKRVPYMVLLNQFIQQHNRLPRSEKEFPFSQYPEFHAL